VSLVGANTAQSKRPAAKTAQEDDIKSFYSLYSAVGKHQRLTKNKHRFEVVISKKSAGNRSAHPLVFLTEIYKLRDIAGIVLNPLAVQFLGLDGAQHLRFEIGGRIIVTIPIKLSDLSSQIY